MAFSRFFYGVKTWLFHDFLCSDNVTFYIFFNGISTSVFTLLFRDFCYGVAFSRFFMV